MNNTAMSSVPIWDSAQLQQALDVHVPASLGVLGISIDSRTIEQGMCFLAIEGEHFDGHDFVSQAFEAGANTAIVTHVPEGVQASRCIIVEDTMQALVDLATYKRLNSDAKFIGVTGSVGKTTVKEMLLAAASTQANTYASKGNLNNHIGVPLCLANMPHDADVAIFEMGMNHAGEIIPLSDLVQPHVAIISNVEPVHIEHFDSVNDIAAAKAEICSGLLGDGTLILNADNKYTPYVKSLASSHYGVTHIIEVGQAEQADVCVKNYDIKNHQITLLMNDKEYHYLLALAGLHHARNSALVLAALNVIGLDIAKAMRVFDVFAAAKGRGQIIDVVITRNRHIRVIDDSYNASLASTEAAIEMLADQQGRKIAALGDMLELGEHAVAFHTQLADKLLSCNIDRLIAIGPDMLNCFNAVSQSMRWLHADSASQLGEDWVEQLQDGDCVLIKGSRGMRMEQLIATVMKQETLTDVV